MADIMRGTTVLVADQEDFESGYVSSALQLAGATVIGPLHSIAEVRALLAQEPAPRLAVLGCRLTDGPAWDLIETLRGRGIACLLLIGPPWDERWDLNGTPVLQKPFAAYQVVEWAAQSAPLSPGLAAGVEECG